MTADAEITALAAILDTLDPLDGAAKDRIARYLMARYGLKFGGSEVSSKGGKARAEKLTPERRAEIAKKAAETRWNGCGRENVEE